MLVVLILGGSGVLANGSFSLLFLMCVGVKFMVGVLMKLVIKRFVGCL